MKERRLLIALLCGLIVGGILVMIFSTARAESRWAMCKGYVNVRARPSKGGRIVGYLDAGEQFETDGTIRNGFIRVLDVGENGDGWAFAGYVSDEEPEAGTERYVCVARKRVACRKWIGGPRISGKAGWLYNGTNVKVYARTGDWCLTNRGYIAAEWLERDPE